MMPPAPRAEVIARRHEALERALARRGLRHTRQREVLTEIFFSTDGLHHDHLICTRCQKIVEFEEERIEVLQNEVAARLGFRLSSHKMELYGLCEDCQRTSDGDEASDH